MKLGGGGKAPFRPFRVALGVHPQQIAGVVAQKVGGDSDSAPYSGGHCHCSRKEHFFFAARDELALVHHVEQGAVIIQFKGEGDLESVVPPGWGELPLGTERVIIFGQSL